MDLTTCDSDGRAWNFDEPDMRERALARVRSDRPMLLVGSPMCTAFSIWQRVWVKVRSEDEQKQAELVKKTQ